MTTRAKFQTGSLIIQGKGKSAKYLVRVRVYDVETGKPSRPKIEIGLVSKMSKREAASRMAEIVAEKTGQLPKAAPLIRRGDTTLSAFYKERFLVLKTHWSKAHRDGFEYIMDSFVLPKFGDLAIASIDKVMVQARLNHLEKDYSWSTIDHVRRKMYDVFEEAIEQDYVTKNPVKKTNVPADAARPARPVLTVGWLFDLINKITDPRDKALFMIAVFCALRTSEVFGLPWGNFHYNEETGEAYLEINQIAYRGERFERTKNKASEAKVHIGPKTLEAILAWRAACPYVAPGELMFQGTNKNGRARKGAPMASSTWLQKRIQPIAEGMDIPFKVNIRAARRTAATQVQENGSSLASAQGLLRHGSSETTAVIYTQPIPENVKKAVNDYEELVFAQKPKRGRSKLEIVRKIK